MNAGDMGSIPDLRRSHMLWNPKPVHHKYWACAQETVSRIYWSLCTLEPVLHNERSHPNEKSVYRN